MVAGKPLQIRSIDFPSYSKPDQSDINLSTKLRNLCFFFYENLTPRYQPAAVKIKSFGGFINIAKNIEAYR